MKGNQPLQPWGDHYTDREFAREIGDPLRTVVEAYATPAPEEKAARLGFGEAWAHPVTVEMAIKGSHSGCIVSTSSEMTPQESALKGVVNARATRSQIVSAIQVLQQLSRRIDNEAEDSIRLGGNWYLEAGRADWIATQGVQRMQAVDTDTAAPGTREALDQLCRTYWYPLYAYVRRRGHTPEDAQDLTQAFFVHFLQENSINQARYTAR